MRLTPTLVLAGMTAGLSPISAHAQLCETADLLGISRATAYRDWTYAKAWLRWELRGSDGAPSA